MSIFAFPPVLSPWGRATVRAYAPIVPPVRAASLFAAVLWDSWTQVPVAFKDVLGAQPSDGSLESWGTSCAVQTINSQGKAGSLDPSWLDYTVLGVEFMARMCLRLSCSFQCGYFFPQCGYRSLSASFWISLRGNCYYAAIHSVYLWKEGNLGICSPFWSQSILRFLMFAFILFSWEFCISLVFLY